MIPIPAPPAAAAQDFLASTRWFRGLDATALQSLLAAMEWLFVAGGEEVCRQGEPGDAIYFVWSGRLAVVDEGGSGEERLLREVVRGDSVGEISIVTGIPRTASVHALRDSELAKLPRAAAEALFERHPAVLVELTRAVAGWLYPGARGRQTPLSISFAVVGNGRVGGVDIPAFARRLVEALSTLGATTLVDAARVDAALGAGSAQSADDGRVNSALPDWINALEAAHRFVVLAADAGSATHSSWTRRCLRQADRILVVVDASAPPDLGPLGDELRRVDRARSAPREELILLQAETVPRPTGTAGWLALHAFKGHHHLRGDHPAGIARLARLLGGHGVALVLGGGGARGLAHIGVIRALQEAGVPIDRIGGTSMGAMVASQLARGYTWAEMIELNRMGWVDMAPQKGFTLPLISLLSAAKAEVMLQLMYGDDRIEDLWTNFFCCSTNLSRTELVVHREGLVRFAVGASMTIPGISPPRLAEGGDLLVDGGVLNNLPADVMRRLAPGPIVAVDVSARLDVHADPTYREPPSPWKILRGRLWRGRRAPEFPNILQLIQRAALMASDVYAKQAKGEVELYLDLPMEGYEMFDMAALDRLVEHGYEFTRKALAESGPELKRQLGIAPTT